MNFSRITWPQVALLFICFGGIVAAYKLLGDGAAAAIAIATHLLLASSSSGDPPAPTAPVAQPATPPKAPDPPKPPIATFGVLAFAVLVGACGLGAQDAHAIASDGLGIGACQERGRAALAADAGKDAAWGAYDACMRAGGFRDGGAP
jgi:hypothetical protein